MAASGHTMWDDSPEGVRAALRACLGRPHGQAWGMPAGFYTSPEFLALEVDELFRREWVCIGRVAEAARRYLPAALGRCVLDGDCTHLD